MISPRVAPPWRIQIYFRYFLYLLWEFRWPLLVFWSMVLLGGGILHLAYHRPDSDRLLPFAEACYAVFLAIFFESYLEFPREWFLQPLFFVIPIVGLGAIADSLVRLGFLVFSRKQRLPEWQRMVASLYSDHFVVVGVGKVGYAIVSDLLALREPVVVVERSQVESSLLEELVALNVPVIRGDGRNRKVLEAAGVGRARAVLLATSDDLANLDAGLTARDLNASARIVLRLFDESLASKVRGAFSMPAISTSRVSAPAFVAAATGRQVYQAFCLAGRTLHLVDMKIASGGRLAGRTVGDVQHDHGVNVVMHSGPQGVNVNPAHDLVLDPGDEILVIAPLARLLTIEGNGGKFLRLGDEVEPAQPNTRGG